MCKENEESLPIEIYSGDEIGFGIDVVEGQNNVANFFSLRSAPVSLQFRSGWGAKTPLYLVLSPPKHASYLVVKGPKKFSGRFTRGVRRKKNLNSKFFQN